MPTFSPVVSARRHADPLLQSGVPLQYIGADARVLQPVEALAHGQAERCGRQ